MPCPRLLLLRLTELRPRRAGSQPLPRRSAISSRTRSRGSARRGRRLSRASARSGWRTSCASARASSSTSRCRMISLLYVHNSTPCVLLRLTLVRISDPRQRRRSPKGHPRPRSEGRSKRPSPRDWRPAPQQQACAQRRCRPLIRRTAFHRCPGEGEAQVEHVHPAHPAVQG